ncbi:MAG: hypothetical protein GY928_04785 [Colwellia sp.]|nr:hypothetical protein [Colwellia sp.]
MSTLSILPYFPFNRIRITNQDVISDTNISQLSAVPDQRYHPVCHECGKTDHNEFTVMKNGLLET